MRGTDAGYVLGVDFQGPFVKSINGKQWCLVAVEARHGYTIVKTLKDKKAKTVKAAMQEIICEFQVAIGKGNTFVVRVHSSALILFLSISNSVAHQLPSSSTPVVLV